MQTGCQRGGKHVHNFRSLLRGHRNWNRCHAIAPMLPDASARAPRTIWLRDGHHRRKNDSERQNGSENLLLTLMRLAQMASVMTVVAVQLVLLIETITSSRRSRSSKTLQSATLSAPLNTPSPSSTIPLTQFQPLLLVGAIVSSAIIRLIGPKQCGSASPQCPHAGSGAAKRL
jgi:hypothetical protein